MVFANVDSVKRNYAVKPVKEGKTKVYIHSQALVELPVFFLSLRSYMRQMVLSDLTAGSIEIAGRCSNKDPRPFSLFLSTWYPIVLYIYVACFKGITGRHDIYRGWVT